MFHKLCMPASVSLRRVKGTHKGVRRRRAHGPSRNNSRRPRPNLYWIRFNKYCDKGQMECLGYGLTRSRSNLHPADRLCFMWVFDD